MIVLPFPSAMSTASSLIPTAVQSLHFSTYKVGGAYRKPLGGRKRAEFIRTLHDPTPKRWELKQPRGVKHDEQKIQRYVFMRLIVPFSVTMR